MPGVANLFQKNALLLKRGRAFFFCQNIICRPFNQLNGAALTKLYKLYELNKLNKLYKLTQLTKLYKPNKLHKLKRKADITMLSVKTLNDRLLSVPNQPILALKVMATIIELENQGHLNGLALLDFAPDIEKAIVEIGDLSDRSERITRQCLELKPKASHRVPIGF